MKHYRKYLAEFFGTFALVFVGCGACIAHHAYRSDITHVGVALAFGGVVMCMVYALGHISGAHINPAVTLAFATVRRFPLRHVPAYLAAQLLGALAASAAHLLTYGSRMAQDAAYGATMPVVVTQAGAFAMEFVLTFLLMFVIMAVATDHRVPGGIGGLAIGAAVCFDCLAAGKCCGASMNPARSFGPALLAGGESLRILWLYVLAPSFGAIAAAWFYEAVRGTKGPRATVPRFDEESGEA
ncbi:MAG TPA: MIP family channel protein [Phycisphaerae bacterium]|nr:MIP family channel protein [Phycisphaerae bacterium]